MRYFTALGGVLVIVCLACPALAQLDETQIRLLRQLLQQGEYRGEPYNPPSSENPYNPSTSIPSSVQRQFNQLAPAVRPDRVVGNRGGQSCMSYCLSRGGLDGHCKEECGVKALPSQLPQQKAGQPGYRPYVPNNSSQQPLQSLGRAYTPPPQPQVPTYPAPYVPLYKQPMVNGVPVAPMSDEAAFKKAKKQAEKRAKSTKELWLDSDDPRYWDMDYTCFKHCRLEGSDYTICREICDKRGR